MISNIHDAENVLLHLSKYLHLDSDDDETGADDDHQHNDNDECYAGVLLGLPGNK